MRNFFRGYKIRLLPNKEQEEYLFEIANGRRKAWNWALDYQINRFKNGNKIISSNELRKEFVKYTKTEEGNWLLKLPQKYLYETFRDLYKAYSRFFKIQKEGIMFSKKIILKRARQNKPLTPYDMKGHPKFKKKNNSKISFSSSVETYFKFDKKNNKIMVHIQKIGFIEVQTNYKLPLGRLPKQKILNPRIVYENDKWTINVVFECDNQAPQFKLNDFVIGIDLGVKELAVATHCDQENNNPKFYKNINKTISVKKIKKRLKRFERKISTAFKKNKSYERTNGINKNMKKLKRCYAKLSNIRKNYIHQITREIVNYLPKAIVIEDLNIKGMMKNHHIARAVSEQMFFDFRCKIEYKAEAYNIPIILVPWNFPSSKKCNNCNNIKKDLKLNDRKYKCKKCGLEIDRDLNAAINLEKYGIQVLESNKRL